jgi:hypothetical protein
MKQWPSDWIIETVTPSHQKTRHRPIKYPWLRVRKGQTVVIVSTRDLEMEQKQVQSFNAS